MSKLRSVSTAFWSDPFIEELTPSEKLLYLYLITNEKTNMLGIYEVSIRKISFETGIDSKTIEKALKRFETLSKVKRVNNYVIMVNFLRHQHFNTNMKKSAIDTYNSLPNELKFSDKTLDRDNPLEAFETLSNGLGMVRKVEVEYESEDEVKIEDESKEEKEILFNQFWDLYDKKTGHKDCLSKWMKFDIDLMNEIISKVPNYVKSKPDKKFRKNPLSFLNGKHWEDEVIFESNQTQGKQLPHANGRKDFYEDLKV